MTETEMKAFKGSNLRELELDFAKFRDFDFSTSLSTNILSLAEQAIYENKMWIIFYS